MYVSGKSKKTVGIVDYGASNLRNIKKSISKIECCSKIITCPEMLTSCDALLIPGMGAASSAIEYMKRNNTFESIVAAKETGLGIVGICLGFQMFYESLSEGEVNGGFGFLKGKVVHLNSIASYLGLAPNIGWRTVKNCSKAEKQILLHEESFYFAHSYTPIQTDENECLAYSIVNEEKISVVSKKDNVIGCQFHPEKSGPKGIEFLKWLIHQV